MSSAPQATIDVLAADAQRAAAAACRRRPRARGRRGRSIRVDARAGVGRRAGVPRARDVGDADVLLGAASGSRTRRRPSRRSPGRCGAGSRRDQPEPLGPAAGRRRRCAPAMPRPGPGATLISPRRGGRTAPARLGSARPGRAARASAASTCVGRAEAGARVDERRAADRAAERAARSAGSPIVAIWPGVAVQARLISRGRAVNVVGVVPLALLEHGDAHAALGELLGDGRAAGARADDAGVDASTPRVGRAIALPRLERPAGRSGRSPASLLARSSRAAGDDARRRRSRAAA